MSWGIILKIIPSITWAENLLRKKLKSSVLILKFFLKTLRRNSGNFEENLRQNPKSTTAEIAEKYFEDFIIIIVYRPFSILRTGWAFSPQSSSSNSFSEPLVQETVSL